MDARCLVRPATHADLADVGEIEREAFADPWPADTFVAHLSDLFLVATNGPTVLGFLIAGIAGPTVEIMNLAVAAAARRRGVAGRLLAAGCDALAAEGVSRVFLAVRISNVAARALYQRAGFHEVGLHEEYYRQPVEDALVVARRLGVP